jgi:hypothetical protein
MTRVRRVLGTIATLWLCSQAATMTLSAAMIGMLPFADIALQCTCTHAAGDSAMCPMHHSVSQPSVSQPSAAQPSAAQPSAALHSAAQHSVPPRTVPPQAAPPQAMLAASPHPGHAGHAAHAAGQQARQTPAPASGGTCYMRSADIASGVALVSVFGPLGLLAPSTFSLAPAIVNPHARPVRLLAIDRTLPPDLPPPRA